MSSSISGIAGHPKNRRLRLERMCGLCELALCPYDIQSAERLFDQAHVMKHRRVSGRGVARLDRLDDNGVLDVRPRGSTLRSKLGAPERREPPPEALSELGHDGVVRAEIDLGMEVDVGGGVGFAVIALDQFGHPIVPALQSSTLDWRHAERGEPRAGRLDLCHRAKQRLELS